MVGLSGNALADFIDTSTVRRRVLDRLVDGPMTPTELATLEKKHVSHVSRALKQLRVQGVVEPVPGDSRERYYRMTAQGIRAYVSLSRIA